jgi:Phage integrase, N-terminal/Integrase
MRDLNYALKQLCLRNRDGSYGTQAERERMLNRIADQLEAMGFRHMGANSLKPKHVERLVERWLAEKLSSATIKNRMSALRWWAQKIGKENVVARSNTFYAIADRVYVTNVSKAKALDSDKLGHVRDLCIRTSLRLQVAFGLRREESIKIIPTWADRGDSLVLKDSWTKGGRAREIPIRTLEQRQLLDQAKALAKGRSLVAPGYATYRSYLKHFLYQCDRAGIHGFHGHRHGYAQARYQELTGWACPARGGPRSREFTPDRRAIDLDARLTISREMGHCRERITAVYLGR